MKLSSSLILMDLSIALASLAGGYWAYNGNYFAFGGMMVFSFLVLVFLIQWYVDLSANRMAKVALQLKDQNEKMAGHVSDVASSLLASDQITADTLADADRDVTRNVKQNPDS